MWKSPVLVLSYLVSSSFVPGAVALAAPLESVKACTLEASLPQLTAAIRNALVAVYAVDGKTLDPAKVTVAAGKSIDVCTDVDSNAVYSCQIQCSKTKAVRSLDVRFVSPSGTPMRLVTGEIADGKSSPDAGLGLSFTVSPVRDEDGNPTGKSCAIDASRETHEFELFARSEDDREHCVASQYDDRAKAIIVNAKDPSAVIPASANFDKTIGGTTPRAMLGLTLATP